jgi:hypothetical protein
MREKVFLAGFTPWICNRKESWNLILCQCSRYFITKSISEQIDRALLSGNPIATPSNSPVEKTADGSVIKTPQAMAKAALTEQLSSADFQKSLAQSIVDKAQALDLGNLNNIDLSNIATAFAGALSEIIASNTSVIDEAINNSDALLADVTHILDLELEGQSGRDLTPGHV